MGLQRYDDESEFIAYVSRESAMAELAGAFSQAAGGGEPLEAARFRFAAPFAADRPALLHVQYTAPLMCRVPVVVSVHDVSFLEYPEYFTPFRSLQLRHTVRRTVRSAARVLTPSEFSKRCIMRAYGLDG